MQLSILTILSVLGIVSKTDFFERYKTTTAEKFQY